MKRVFGRIEMIFDGLYLALGAAAGLVLLCSANGSPARLLAGVMALVLAGGDAFHLLPRIALIRTGDEARLMAALGRGKQITSLTMTIFYLLLWEIGRLVLPAEAGFWSVAMYLLAALRALLCLLPQNGWTQRNAPLAWGIWRNIPFLCMGLIAAGRFLLHRGAAGGLSWMWLAIVLSFAFYLPVVLFSARNPKLGMLMLPKTCAYLWMLAMCLSL